MSKIIVMLGAPGAGKGTQARLLAERFDYPQVATGEILREMATAETPLGRDIRETLAAGRLVGDEVLADVIWKRTSQPDCRDGYILDGFPRTLRQERLLEEVAAQQAKRICVVRVVVSLESLMKRLTGRRTCSKCGEIYNIYLRPPRREGVCDFDGAPLRQRADDRAETVSTRLAAYEESTAPLVEYYRASGRLTEVDGERPVEEVFRQLCAAVGCPGAQAAGGAEDPGS
jgi:adenylate kinase